MSELEDEEKRQLADNYQKNVVDRTDEDREAVIAFLKVRHGWLKDSNGEWSMWKNGVRVTGNRVDQ